MSFSKSTFSPLDIINLRVQYGVGKMLKADLEKVPKPDSKTKGDKPTFVNFKCISADGSYKNLTLKLNKCVIGNIKYAGSTDTLELEGNGITKNMTINYRKLTVEILNSSDYLQKDFDSLLANNEHLLQALDIIQEEIVLMCQFQILTYKGKNLKSISNKKITTFIQKYRACGDSDEPSAVDPVYNPTGDKVLMEHPIYRLKLKFYLDNNDKKNNGRIGKTVYANKNKSFAPIVYDTRRSIEDMNQQRANGLKKITPKEFEAKILTEDRLCHLDRQNVKEFITPLSLSSGEVTFDSICISNFGLSSNNDFNKMFVYSHRKIDNNLTSQEDLTDFTDFETKEQTSTQDVPKYPTVEDLINTPSGLNNLSLNTNTSSVNNLDENEEDLTEFEDA